MQLRYEPRREAIDNLGRRMAPLVILGGRMATDSCRRREMEGAVMAEDETRETQTPETEPEGAAPLQRPTGKR